MARYSSEPRDRNSVHGCRRTVNNGRCLDCRTPTRHAELCWRCMQALAGEAPV